MSPSNPKSEIRNPNSLPVNPQSAIRNPQFPSLALVLDRLVPGGKERVVVELARELRAMGCAVCVVVLGDASEGLLDELRRADVPVETLRTRPGTSPRTTLRLTAVLWRCAPDVVNVHDRSSLRHAWAVTQTLFRRPVVLSCHGLLESTRRAARSECLAARAASAVTAVSGDSAERYAQLLHLQRPVTVIPNGAPPVQIDPAARSALRGQLGVPDDVPLLLAVGNIKPEKGYDDLLDACRLLRQGGAPPFALAIAGAGDERTLGALRDRARRVGVEAIFTARPGTPPSGVHVLGYRADVAALYAAADVFVLPSRTEGLPLALLEAMSASLAVVATRVGGVPEALDGGAAGLLVPPQSPPDLAAALRELLRDPARRADLAAAAQQRALTHYTPHTMAQRYLAVFTNVVPAPPARHTAFQGGEPPTAGCHGCAVPSRVPPGSTAANGAAVAPSSPGLLGGNGDGGNGDGSAIAAEPSPCVAERSNPQSATCPPGGHNPQSIPPLAQAPNRKSKIENRKSPRVLLLGPAGDRTGGMATVIANLQQGLRDRGVPAAVLDTGKLTPPQRPLWMGVGAQVRLLGQLVRRVRGEGADIVHIHTCSGFTFARDVLHALAARMMGARVVWHIHGGRFAAFLEGLGRPQRAVVRGVLTRASAVIVLSPRHRRRLAAFAPRARWCVVPNGVPVPGAPADAPPPDAPFLFLGHLSHAKGALDLVRAAALARQGGTPLRIHLAGAESVPGQRADIERLAAALGLADDVLLLGALDPARRDAALDACRALVLPSYSEAMPMAILEALARGRAVVASNVGDIPDTLTDGAEGFLIHPGDLPALADRLLRLAGDPALPARMGRAGWERARKEFSLHAAADRVLRVYQSVWEREV